MLCGVTATLGSNPSATATAARPQWGRAVLLCLGGVPCCCVAVWPHGRPGAGGPGRCVCRWAAARPRAVRAASFARRVVSKPGQAPPPPTGTAADPSGAVHTGGACAAGVWSSAFSRSPARPHRRPPISHVIPLRLVQTLNLHRWNCNVCGVSRKMTTINYVRNLGGGGVVAARGCRRQARGLFEAAPPGI